MPPRPSSRSMAERSVSAARRRAFESATDAPAGRAESMRVAGEHQELGQVPAAGNVHSSVVKVRSPIGVRPYRDVQSKGTGSQSQVDPGIDECTVARPPKVRVATVDHIA